MEKSNCSNFSFCWLLLMKKETYYKTVQFSHTIYISIHVGGRGIGISGISQEMVCMECVNNELNMPFLEVNPSWTTSACASVHCWVTPASQNTLRKWVVLLNVL